MKVVLDSNVLLVAIGKRSRFKPIWEAFLEGKYQLIISEDIIHEYEEILYTHSASGAAELIMEIFSESPDIIYRRAFFTWNAISADPDDNKFFDAAIAGDADYLVTNDAHFNEVKDSNFPKVNVIDADNFISILKNL
ncbi:MAG: putative toxin-antitoxin system toxin component, PIN family [Chitinophagaceae bacterium]|nr:MAG: putative toxin-antitoxin system toxin component, PIN family [Chitinophagaceae bacterium]